MYVCMFVYIYVYIIIIILLTDDVTEDQVMQISQSHMVTKYQGLTSEPVLSW